MGVRSTMHDDELVGYSGLPMPKWNTPVGWCTEGGAEIMKQTGAALVTQFGFSSSDSQVRIVSDFASQRDFDTALAIAQGMGLKHTSIEGRSSLFGAQKNKICDPTDPNTTIKERQDRFKKVKTPWDVTKAVSELQELIGVGPKGKLPTDGQVGADGKPSKAFKYLQDFGQLMFYANVSNISYSNATQAQLNKFLAWQHYMRSVSDYTTEELINQGSGVLSAVLGNLQQTDYSTNIYAGHDDTLDGIAVALNLTWDAPPYMGGNLLPTLPGGALHFELDRTTGAISLSYVYHEFNAAGPFKLKSSLIKTYASVDALSSALTSGLKSHTGAWECFQKFPLDGLQNRVQVV